MAVGQLGCRVGRHPLTRFGTLSTQLHALLDQLIGSSYLFTILSALPTQLGTEATDSVMKRRLPKHEINRGRAHLCTVL
jgi:hypothetical protein